MSQVRKQIIYRILILQRSPWWPMALRRWLLNRLGARIDSTARISFGFRCYHPEKLVMKRNSFINADCYFDGEGELLLEECARIGSGTTLLTGAHRIMDRTLRRDLTGETDYNAPVRIGRGVWIGAQAMVLPGCDIADGCVIGAKALVTHSTEPDGLYVNMAGENGAIAARRLRDLANGDRPHGPADASVSRIAAATSR